MLRRFVAAALVAVVTSFAAGPVQAKNYMNSAEEEQVPPGADMLFVRPLGVFGLAAGLILWAPATVVTLLTRPHEIDEPFKAFVWKPIKFVFLDPLGRH